MMTWEEMKKIAAERTKSSWVCGVFQYDDIHYAAGPDCKSQSKAMQDGEFMSMSANNWDKIQAVVDAAWEVTREAAQIFPLRLSKVLRGVEKMQRALKELEREPIEKILQRP